MRETPNGKMITLAREARGLTQTELAQASGIHQSTISKIELGNQFADEESLEKLSVTLKYPKKFFYQRIEVYPPNLHYRKRVALPQKTLVMAEATMNIFRANVQTLLQAVELPYYQTPFIDGQKRGDPAEVAMFLRQYWNIPKGPIENLVNLLESKGIVIIPCEFNTEKIDGRSMITEKGNPVIFLNRNLSGERQRFTLAHELAHLILHVFTVPFSDDDTEKEADIFAGEFMMPAAEIRQHFIGKLTVTKLSDLKRYWKMSMAAILKRAQDLNAVTPNQAKYLWIQFGTLGIRKKEPLELPFEKPRLLKEIINAHLTELRYTIEDIASLLCLEKDEFEEMYDVGKPQLIRLVR